MKLPMPLILILIFVINTSIALFLYYMPSAAIEIQKKFYERINWRIEPISMQKEIRNTKIMGLSLIIITLVAIVYAIIKAS